MAPELTQEIATDAGLYREWLVARYGQVLSLGGSVESMERACRHARRIAALAGMRVEEVIRDVQADYETIH